MIVHHDLLIVQLYFSYRPQWPQNNLGLFKFSGDRNNWFNIDKPILNNVYVSHNDKGSKWLCLILIFFS